MADSNKARQKWRQQDPDAAVGLVKESPAILQRMISYLQKHE